jgi:hypothetical protein
MAQESDNRRKQRQASEHRDRMARRSREIQASVSDIGELPAVTHPKRKKACRLDLRRFLETYFPHSTGLKPFSLEHLEVIAVIQECALAGGKFIEALPRGFAKTTISENSVLWATLYGHRRFVPIFGSDAGAADANIDSIKLELSENDLLYEDFPEVCHAVRALEGKPQRCASQTYQGRLTHIEWRADTIVLPTIPKSAASGAIITAHGLLAASRGMKHKRPDGTQQRPDFVIIDDPQTDESAATDLQVAKRLNVIRKSILKLGGHSRQIAAVINATVIRRGDMVDQLLNPKLNPAWQGRRIRMVKKWAEAHETLWLSDYARIRNTYDAETLGDQQRAHREATEFYRRNRDAMDVGCEATWEHCFDETTELSAIQHAYNLLIDDGPEVFASECQNEPLEQKSSTGDELTAEQIAAKTNGYERGLLPAAASRVVAFIDVQKTILYWMVCGFEEGFGGCVLDYGTFPKQARSYFAAREARPTIQKAVKSGGLEESIYAALEATVADLSGRDWKRDDGAVLKIERLLIDANWGESTDVVYQFCRQSPHAAILVPSHGRYYGAASRQFEEYRKQPGDREGRKWRMPNVRGRRSVRYVYFDTNAWKTFMHERLRTPLGGRGCVSLFGQDPQAHKLLADHLTAEEPVPVEAKGRTVVEWKIRNTKPDNHWLDCFVGCGVAASIQGASLMGETAPVTRERVKLSALQKRAKVWKANS